MNDNNTHREANPRAVSRRGALHAGLLGLGGMSLATLLRQRAEASQTLPEGTKGEGTKGLVGRG